MEFVANVDPAVIRAGHEAGQHNALDQKMGSAPHELAVLEGAWLALVGVGDDVLDVALLVADGGPLAEGGKAGAAHAAQAGEFQLLEDAVGVAALREPADRFISRLAVVGVDLPAEGLAVGVLVR